MNNKVYFTTGPTELYPVVQTAVEDALKHHICSINHRSDEFISIYKRADASLRKLLNIPDTHLIMFLGSATECMDRILKSCVDKYSHHFVNGAFAERFYKTALELGKNATATNAEHGKGFESDLSDIPSNAEMICFTQNETSSGVAVDLETIYSAKKKFPDSLVAVDIVTAAPFIAPDLRYVDSAFFSVQKGFGMPAGLGVLIAGRDCLKKAEALKNSGKEIGSYHNLLSLSEYAAKYQNTETPNVLAIYLLGVVCDFLNELGREKIESETREKASILYQALNFSKSLSPVVEHLPDRSQTIIVASAEDQKSIKKALLEEGYAVSSGYGKYKESEIRIANFPMHKLSDVQLIAKIIESF